MLCRLDTNYSRAAAPEIPVPSEASACPGRGEPPEAADVQRRKDGAEPLADQWSCHGLPSAGSGSTAGAAAIHAFARVGPSLR